MAEESQSLIICSPYEKPARYLNYIRETRKFEIVEGRRPAGYVVASFDSKTFDDPGTFIELPLVNKIRKRVDKWRDNRYPGITNITRSLLDYWTSKERKDTKLFFCQIEAIETLIWLTEAPENERQGIEIPNDGSTFQRICSKMATGTGKTVVMAMLIAWQVINKATYKQDTRFTKNILIVAPGLTVKSRLQVLRPYSEKNYYQEFDIIPPSNFDKLRQARVKIINWHTLSELDEPTHSVIKLGEESDEAYTRRVLGDFADAKNLLVINDEAHHAWRTNVKAEGKYQRVDEDVDSAEEATIWVSGLDKINKTRHITKCHDFSATPFAPSGKKSTEETLFGWIISDFGLNDAIESGLVKTPRVVIRDDGELTKEIKSKFYHIYADADVKSDLNRKGKTEATEPLPDLVIRAYYFLGKDWLDTYKLWKSVIKTPPVMITVCNKTDTSARVEYSFNHGKIRIDELKNPEYTLRIDSKLLKEAESRDTELEGFNATSKKDFPEILRQKVDTVGKEGELGEKIQNIIAVSMLSEGWDTKTVTHIMGLRAFSSQLLCEQVVGRGLRRTSYEVNEETGLFEPEYVNIFGIPFTFLPHEGGGDGLPPAPQKPKTMIYLDEKKKEYEITWPNVVRINYTYKPKLNLDMSKIKSIELRPEDTPLNAELAPIINGKADVEKMSQIEIESLGKKYRKQRIIFETTQDIFEQMQPAWSGSKDVLFAQLIKIVEEFINSDKLVIKGITYNEEFRKNLMILLNMNKIVRHVFSAIRFDGTESIAAIFDKEAPIKSTSNMISWYTGRRCEITKKSQISHIVVDSTWEASEAFEMDRNTKVKSWVKNDHIGFVINYIYAGGIHKYYPDFLIKLVNGKMLILEVKGEEDEMDTTKREYLKEWVKAVNADGRFGEWCSDVSYRTSDIKDILEKYSN
jgi:type III restriction enzyme